MRCARSGRPRSTQRGLTLLELAVAMAVMAVLAGVFLGAVRYYQELGEKNEVQLTILNIRSGLRQQLAERMFAGRMHELPELSRVNPVRWLERPPARYAGEVRGAQVDSLARGTWYFDTEYGELRYRPRLHSHLAPDLDYLSWKVVAIPAASGREIVESVALVNVTAYEWF